MDEKNNRKIPWIYFTISSIVGIVNIVFLENQTMATVVVFLQCLILLILLILNRITTCYSILLIFSSLCIESSVFAGTDVFYNFKNTRILGLNLVIWFLLIIIVVLLILKTRIDYELLKSMKSFILGFLFIVSFGTIMGIINIIINDNNIRNIDNYWSEYISVFYTMALFPLLFASATLLCLFRNPNDIYKIKIAILAVFFGVSIQIAFSALVGYRIKIAGLDGIGVASSLVIFYIPIAVCAAFYKGLLEKSCSYVYFFVTIGGTVFALLNNANGKIIILTVLMPFIICLILNKKIVIPLVLLFVVVVSIVVIPMIDSDNNYLLSSKIEEVSKLFDITSPNWLSDMPASPRYRIAEFINSIIELFEKPFYLFFGKGYLGSITDHVNMFVRVGGDFSEVQWKNGSFYYLHESLNLLLLNNGFFGVWFWIKTLKTWFRNYKKTFFILFGGIWFCLTYGYSVTITSIGMTALILGFYDIYVSMKTRKNVYENTVL
ncbi:MAG: hypothetical protein ILA24_03845 [Ruminococcus sp.]|nr:hypothetical protein [Ruminococcus sp.]